MFAANPAQHPSQPGMAAATLPTSPVAGTTTMATPNYSYAKKQREQAKKQKKAEKQQRKAPPNESTADPGAAPAPSDRKSEG